MQPNYLPDSQKAFLSCFLLFDGNMPAEGSEPAVLHTIFIDKKDKGETRKAPTNSEENSENSHSNNTVKSNPFFIVNQVGLFLTFLKFSTRFSQDAPCDYIRTDKHEIVILELENQVWMSIQRETPLTELSNRNSLHSMLRSCKNIYQLFFNPPKRDPETNLITPLSINHLKSAFNMIINSMAWADLGFIHLFESFFQLTPDKTFSFAINHMLDATVFLMNYLQLCQFLTWQSCTHDTLFSIHFQPMLLGRCRYAYVLNFLICFLESWQKMKNGYIGLLA